MIQMNLFINRNRLTDIQKPMVTTKERGGWVNEEFGMNRYTLLCIK